jgi:hypothetical protein
MEAKITAVIFNRVPNHQTGNMGYSDRVVGKGYFIGDVFGEVTEIEKGWDGMTRQDPIIAVKYETGAGKIITHVIPYKDVELIYEEDGENNEEKSE